MPTTRLEIVTAERTVFSDDVDMVIVPGAEGQLGILPRHAHLLTSLQPGELRVKRGGEETSMVVTGGFLEVGPQKVVILADACERVEEIDVERAEYARRRAEERLAERPTEVDLARAEAALRRSLVRLKAAEKRKKRQPPL